MALLREWEPSSDTRVPLTFAASRSMLRNEKVQPRDISDSRSFSGPGCLLSG